ncbi:hypothetical protein [Geothermobacter hydrogeniphilus]|uniref:Uncharacterized protein n=1 Tax=Geothermobacter hydrogeniphilus TaxID=1969733 RepID=A0A1X0XX85_9BACT|nr:hypothetical protein [Geothermobacter hydrogeniphilus]ORJ57479.1 hypothetical protein B5V00_13600 [Geothermobacter hydrogeniphilus]
MMMTAEEAIAWVEKNARQIKVHTRRYLPFVPYDQEDFLQDAREAALLAVRVAERKNLPFAACFWMTLKNRISEVTPYPESKCHAGSVSPPSNKCWPSEYFGCDEKTPALVDLIDVDRLYWMVSAYLTRTERRVLGLALGLDSGRKGIKEIAREIGCTPANVRQTLNRSYRRLSQLVASGELILEIRDIEARRFPHSPRRRRKVETEEPKAA